MNSAEQGYADKRFPSVVDENFHCPICLHVLRDPVQCRRNEHYFCTPCIAKHLEQNSQACPVCMDPLTLKTVREPSRIVSNYLATLKISCDYAQRGCRELVELRALRMHAENCDFSPVICSNDGCSKSINKRDRVRHETEICKNRKVKCSGCGKKVQYKKYETHGCVLKRTMEDLKGQHEEMKDDISKLKDLTRKMDQRQTAQEKTMKEMKNIIQEMHEQIKKLTSQMSPSQPTGQIVVAGGHDGSSYLNSAELFDCTTKTWLSLPPMKERRLAPSSFMYQNHIIVDGGFAGEASTDRMEGINVGQEPKQWRKFPARLPFKTNRHTSVAFQNRLIIAGGEDADEGKISDAVYEVLITPPNTATLVCRMPQPRVSHGAALFNDKMLIVGGRTSNRFREAVCSVLLFDVNKRKCKEMAPLPYEVSQMAVVSHGDKLVVLGGQDKDGNVLDKVVMYDFETGRCEMLPSMNVKRAGSTAVVAGDVIVVMGGRDDQKNYLSSVESFSFDHQVWEELPSMTTPRTYATSFVKPAP